MLADLARNWWLLAIRGLFGILFGIGAFVWPEATLAALVLLFGSYSLVDGIFAVAAGIGMRGQQGLRWLMVIEGLAGIGLGVLTLLSPGLTALVLLYIVAGWSVITGAFEIASAVRLRKVIAHEWLLIFAGIASIIFGVFLIASPGPGALSLIWLIGSYALIFGILTVMLSFRLRGERASRVAGPRTA
jgi:uncharacterized membrane protein HdeD (DUF308 family)